MSDLLAHWPALMVWGLAGLLLGAAFFASLALNVRWLLTGRALPLALGLQLLRMLGAGAGLWFAAVHGAPALIAMAAGFLLARPIVLRLRAVRLSEAG